MKIDPNLVKDIVYGIILAAGLWFKSWKDRKNTKKDNEELRIQMAEAALKLAETHKEQLERDAKQLRAELRAAAEKLAEQAEKQAQEKMQLEANEKKTLDARKGIEVSERIDREVRHAEQKILNEYKAQRMYIIHFSNGTITEAGIHLMKITFDSEVVERYDVEKISRYFNEKPIPDMFKSPMRRAMGGEYHYVMDIGLMDKSDPSRIDYFNWLSAYRVKSVLWIPLRSSDGRVVAIMVAHWFATTHFDDKDISKIKDMKNDIEAIYDRIQTPKIKL